VLKAAEGGVLKGAKRRAELLTSLRSRRADVLTSFIYRDRGLQ
jgi:hypothetical protein